MSNICPTCKTFVSINYEKEAKVKEDSLLGALFADVEGNEVRFSTSARITGNCENCGEEMKEATLELDGHFDIDPDKFWSPDSDLNPTKFKIEVDRSKRTDSGEGSNGTRMLGVVVSFDLMYDDEYIDTMDVTDEIAASEMSDC
jgi:hypothetical protein